MGEILTFKDMKLVVEGARERVSGIGGGMMSDEDIYTDEM